MAGDYLEYTARKYRQEQKALLLNTPDIVRLRNLYRTLTALLDSEGELERLNLLLRQRFLTVMPMAAFIQGLANDPPYSLVSRDIEPGKRAV